MTPGASEDFLRLEHTMPESTPAPLSGGRRKHHTVKQLKRALKAAGHKTSGSKAALTRRVKHHRLRV